MKKTTNKSENKPDTPTTNQPEVNSGQIGKVLPDTKRHLHNLLYAHQQTPYLIDEGKREEFSFSHIEIHTKQTCLKPTLFQRHIYNRKPLRQEFKIKLTDVERLKRGSEGMSVSLYQKGVSAPLIQEIVEIEEEEVTIDWTYRVKELEPGGYFLWLRGTETMFQQALGGKIGKDTKVDFEILEDGDELPHPEITQIILQEEDLGLPLFKSDARLRTPVFEITLAQPVEEGNMISACCYNDELYQMTEELEDGYPVSKSVFKIRLDGSIFWMPGRYDVILLHNQSPFTRFSFYMNKEGLDVGELIPVERYDKYYMLGRYLSVNQPDWNELSQYPASAGLRKGITDNLEAIGFNKIHFPYLGINLYGNMNYLIECPDDDESFEMIRLFSLVIGNRTLMLPYDCKDDVDQYHRERRDEEERFKVSETIFFYLLLNAGCLLQNGGDFMMSKVIDALRTRKYSFVFICNKGEGERLLEAYPVLRTYLPESHRISMLGYSTSAIAYEIRKKTFGSGKVMSCGAFSKMADILLEAEKQGLLADWNKEYIMNYVYDTLLTNFRKRKLAAKMNEEETVSGHIEAEDIDSISLAVHKESFEEAMSDLNAMIGLGQVKHNFEAVMYTLRMFQLRKNAGLNSTFDMSHHMLFIGNPGTGKTTVARMIGRIFRSLGLLSKGDVIVADRGRLVGQWIGETERKVGEILVQAQGNVLFIDEAYSLASGSGDRRDFGYRVIECLMPLLSSNNPNMLVIMAGYPKEMDMLMEKNAGLKGRFPYRFNFDDYTAEELIMIGKNLLEKNDYQLSTEAEELFCAIVQEAVKAKDRNFSNARWVEQFIRNRILPAMAERIVLHHQKTDKEYYRRIELMDMQKAYTIEKEKNSSLAARPPIGFSR